jgi:hypothetical protein
MSSSMIRLAAIFLLCFAVGFIGGQISAAEPENVLISRDTDLNGILESYHLVNKQLTVWEGRQMIWQTPAEWEIERILLADADNDGVDELLMVLWKHGSFGDVRPFWQSADRAYSCHLFMYRLQAGRMRAVWCSSAIDPPIADISAITDNAQQVSLEIKERSTFPYPATRSTWQWQDWGFARVDA